MAKITDMQTQIRREANVKVLFLLFRMSNTPKIDNDKLFFIDKANKKSDSYKNQLKHF